MIILAASLLAVLARKASDSKVNGSFKLGMGTLSDSAALTMVEAESEMSFASLRRSEAMISERGKLKEQRMADVTS